MKTKIVNFDRKRSAEENQPTLAIIRNLPLTRIMPVFDDCSLEELQYFLNRAVEQEEYELCKHLKDLIDLRYNCCVA